MIIIFIQNNDDNFKLILKDFFNFKFNTLHLHPDFKKAIFECG